MLVDVELQRPCLNVYIDLPLSPGLPVTLNHTSYIWYKSIYFYPIFRYSLCYDEYILWFCEGKEHTVGKDGQDDQVVEELIGGDVDSGSS